MKDLTDIFRVLLIAVITFITLSGKGQEFKNYFTPAEMNKANTAVKSTFLTDDEKEVIRVMNLARLYPKKFLKYYTDYAKKRYYDLKGDKYYSSLTTHLQTMQPVSALVPDQELYDFAKCWAKESGELGVTGHKRQSCASDNFAECCNYGSDNPVYAVMSLFIDKGNPGYGHRKIMLDGEFTRAGVSMQAHKTYDHDVVIDFK